MRLIDLDNVKPMDFPSCEMDGLDVIRYLNTLPTVDAVILPCKVGDTVWILGDKHPAEVEDITITNEGIVFGYAEYERSYYLTELWDDGEFRGEDIGKTVFLTMEEYDAALEMDGGNEDG